ncbi:hypothetical protein PISL3812_00358 [Talaromyces islandicus]|uniref:Uncharacterized protein n=1 Tax=Talaromyces islandicus TaxID=28573 RepID=A0A0U1LL11_TALIS|nr:hypothetical protein PISL3812_00358 [Talaromyces islandicus]
MSGSNPFRRSKILAASESIPSIPDSSNHSSNDAPPNLNNVGVFDHPKSHSKSVRIATPPAPSPAAAESSRSHFPAAPTTTTRTLHSPPPLGTGDSDSSDESTADPFNPHASAVDTLNENKNDNDERAGSEPRPRYQRTTSQNDTLAGNNPGPRLSISAEPQGRGLEETGVESKRKSNATLDVDAFTRLLLTGNAEELSTPKKTAMARIDTDSDLSTPASQIDNDNNIDIESPAALQRIHTDNTSSLGASEQSLKVESNDNIQRTASVKRPKPPPPKTRHGKPIKVEEPQQSSRKPSAEGYPSGDSSQKSIYPKTSISPPADHREEMAAALEANLSSNSSDSGVNDDVSSLHRTSSQTKRPPTPPLARRHSQIKPNKTPQPRPRDNLHRISMPPRGLGLQVPGPPSPGFKTPPRPPSRRHGEPLAGSQTDSVSQPKSSLSQDHPVPPPTFAVEEPLSANSSSPPSRQPSIKRSPSGSAAHMPPPPPPPRRARTSSKGSVNNPALASMQTKMADDQTENEPPPSSHATDILADLSRLQQEVDSLRGHYENRKVSQ